MCSGVTHFNWLALLKSIGMIDVIRAQGSWFHAVRYGYHFGIGFDSLHYHVPPSSFFTHLASMFETMLILIFKTQPPSTPGKDRAAILRNSLEKAVFNLLNGEEDVDLTKSMKKRVRKGMEVHGKAFREKMGEAGLGKDVEEGTSADNQIQASATRDNSGIISFASIVKCI